MRRGRRRELRHKRPYRGFHRGVSEVASGLVKALDSIEQLHRDGRLAANLRHLEVTRNGANVPLRAHAAAATARRDHRKGLALEGRRALCAAARQPVDCVLQRGRGEPIVCAVAGVAGRGEGWGFYQQRVGTTDLHSGVAKKKALAENAALRSVATEGGRPASSTSWS